MNKARSSWEGFPETSAHHSDASNMILGVISKGIEKRTKNNII